MANGFRLTPWYEPGNVVRGTVAEEAPCAPDELPPGVLVISGRGPRTRGYARPRHADRRAERIPELRSRRNPRGTEYVALLLWHEELMPSFRGNGSECDRNRQAHYTQGQKQCPRCGTIWDAELFHWRRPEPKPCWCEPCKRVRSREHTRKWNQEHAGGKA